MAFQYPSINAQCTCTDKNGTLTKLGRRHYEYQKFLDESPNDTEILRRMGYRWTDLGVRPHSAELISPEKRDALLARNSSGGAMSKIDEVANRKRYEEIRLAKKLLPVEAVNRMGLTRMCCRSAFLNPPMISFIDRASGVFEDLSIASRPIVVDGEVPTPARYLPPLPSLF